MLEVQGRSQKTLVMDTSTKVSQILNEYLFHLAATGYSVSD
jgi:hypothetical protein